jgi:hypothetical protein
MGDLAEHHDSMQIAVPAPADGRSYNRNDSSARASTGPSRRAERRLAKTDVRPLLHWIPRLLVVLVLLCLTLATWVWFEILWGL